MSNLASIEQEKKQEKENRAEKVKREKLEKEARKFVEERAFQGKKNELMKGMIDDVGKGIEHLKKLANRRQKDILIYYYREGESKVNKPKKADLIEALTRKGLATRETPQEDHEK